MNPPIELLRRQGWDTAAEYLEEHPVWRRDAHLDIAEAEAVIGRVGRNKGPAILFDLWFGRCIDRDVLAAVLPGVWVGADSPVGSVPRNVWLTWFRLVAYPKPAEPMTIYRGAPPRYARGMSWTTRYSKAEWFAGRWGINPGRAVAHVYEVIAEPGAVLADMDAIYEGRQEAEIIVDPTLLPKLRRASGGAVGVETGAEAGI